MRIKQTTNYGYPFSRFMLRMILALLIILTIILFIFTQTPSYITFFFGVFITFIYLYFAIYLTKIRYENYDKNIIKNLLKLAKIEGSEIILDIGTGAGLIAIGFAKHVKNGKVYAVDLYSLKGKNLLLKLINFLKINFLGNSLENAKRNAKIENVDNKCEFIIGDITKGLILPDCYFDVITSSQALYCISTKEQIMLFKEINRLLKSDGKFIIYEPRKFNGWNINTIREYFRKKGYKICVYQPKELRLPIISGKKFKF